MRITRRTLLGGAAAAAVAGGGIYELVDRLGSAPARPLAEPAGMPLEQHLLDLATTQSEGVEVVVPPLHSVVVTANLDNLSDLRGAQRQLEDVLRRIDSTYALTPAGLGVTVAWSQTYFDTYVSTQAKAHLPYDRRAQKSVLVPTRRFPSDPANAILEANDVAVLFRSDRVEHIEVARNEIFDLPFLTVTSIRRGFAGGGFGGGQSLPKKMAVAAGVPGADLIPDGSELFLGFTSTQKAGLGPGTIANHETLGYVDLRSGYFRNGTHMHLSHISEDLEAWYLNFDFDERVLTAFRPGMTNVRQGMQTVPQGPAAVSAEAELVRQFHKTGRFGHSASIQATSRLLQDTIGEDGTHYPKGTAIPQRADFNTLDNPFAFSADPKGDGLSNQPAAGVHFVVFNPSGDDFERNRLAMDGVFPDGKKLPVQPRNRAAGFNSVLTTTHRQNFLVPPRRHRSLPLVEL
ncbi:MAG TPA: hypothetical protein VMU74_11345 [Gaiellaceae bacterium]|nr:hypothetical protein [Gaiellaceae bacterium]